MFIAAKVNKKQSEVKKHFVVLIVPVSLKLLFCFVSDYIKYWVFPKQNEIFEPA